MLLSIRATGSLSPDGLIIIFNMAGHQSLSHSQCATRIVRPDRVLHIWKQYSVNLFPLPPPPPTDFGNRVFPQNTELWNPLMLKPPGVDAELARIFQGNKSTFMTSKKQFICPLAYILTGRIRPWHRRGGFASGRLNCGFYWGICIFPSNTQYFFYLIWIPVSARYGIPIQQPG